jgi:maleamate amidohydrolase
MNNAALLIIDMQNSFLHREGENYYPQSREVVEPVTRLLECARASDCLVVHTVDRHRSGLPDFEQKRLPQHSIEGSMDAQYFDGFGPDPTSGREIEIVKRRFSAFFATDLALLLNECRIETVVICGVKTNVCVRATSQDAFAHGFKVIVPRQATNSNRPNLAQASLEDISRYLGNVVELGEAIAMLKECAK